MHRLAAVSISTFLLLTCAVPARASLVLNGSFENVGSATKSFSISNPTILTNWAASPNGNHVLDCLVMLGDTSHLCGSPNGWNLQFWNNGSGGSFLGGPSPDGGNYVAIDGDQNYESALTQTLIGLVAGTDYEVKFYQAATQQYSFNGATTERWQVSFGNTTKLSTLMNTPSHGYVGWMSQSMTFTASAASQTLSFLAIGTPNGLPPFVLLDGVSVEAAVPEPGTLTMFGLGLAACLLGSRFRKKS